jgi:nitrite reductase/ring-hydroxylating ferredoxin subunit
LKYLAGLSEAVARYGGRIYGGTPVSRVEGGSPCRVSTTSGVTIRARSVVVATNSPIHENLLVHLKQSPYRTYAIAADIAPGSVPMALYWDTADPFHYVRLQPGRRGRDILIAGGEDHRTGDEDDGDERFEALESWTKARFPIGRVTHRWSGQVMESADGVGLIGHDLVDHPNVYFSTGDSGQGITHGTIAGMLISDLIHGRHNPWRGLYDPARLPVQSGEFYQDGLEVLWHYAEWLTSGDVGTRGAIERGEGAVIREGVSKVAVYREDNGQTVAMSAVCPHLGCIVQWNSTEKEWECPCHGSRFDRRGANVSGPAAAPLARIKSSHA